MPQPTTKCEQFLQLIQQWAFDRRAYSPGLAEPLPVERETWSWRTVASATQRLVLPDGSRAVRYVETGSDAAGLMQDLGAAAVYTPGERVVRIRSSHFSDRSLSSVFHEFAHALLHHDVSDEHYRQNFAWVESEADVVCDLVRCMLGAGPRMATMRTLDDLGSASDIAAFFHFASDVLVPAAEKICLAWTEAVQAQGLRGASELC